MGVRVTAVAFRGKVENRDAVAPLLSEGGDVAIVARGKPHLLVMRCPCGCGDDLLINLDKHTGPAWHYYLNRYGLTLFPSYSQTRMWVALHCSGQPHLLVHGLGNR